MGRSLCKTQRGCGLLARVWLFFILGRTFKNRFCYFIFLLWLVCFFKGIYDTRLAWLLK